jgi:CRP/FNR family transcriptional activator FtrB
MKAATIKGLEGLSAMAGVTPSVLSQLAEVSIFQRAARGAILFREDERAHCVYCLVAGTVSLQSGPKGNETIVDFIQPGDIILIPPALLGQPYMVSAQAVSDLVMVVIPAHAFCRLANSDLSLSRAVNRLLARHWRLLLRHLTHAKTSDVDTRLKEYLSDLAGKEQGSVQLALPGTKKELAAHLGMTPESLSRSLKRLRRLGVRTQRTEIRIEDVTRLKSNATDANALGTGVGSAP